MIVLAIDPGTEQSAYVVYDVNSRDIFKAGISDNTVLLEMLKRPPMQCDHLAIEMLKSYGNVLGDSCLETCVWVGRFMEAWTGPLTRLPRKTITAHLCHNSRAGDKNVRQALLDMYGGKAAAIGRKKTPGPLYNIKADMWSALAVAVVWGERWQHEDQELVFLK